VDHLLAKKPHERPTAREALILIPSFVKKAYEDSKKEKKVAQRALNVSDLTESSIDIKETNPSITSISHKQINLGTSHLRQI
jgi:hypothetical protein